IVHAADPIAWPSTCLLFGRTGISIHGDGAQFVSQHSVQPLLSWSSAKQHLRAQHELFAVLSRLLNEHCQLTAASAVSCSVAAAHAVYDLSASSSAASPRDRRVPASS